MFVNVAQEDLITRIGIDEFVVLRTHANTTQEAENLTERLV